MIPKIDEEFKDRGRSQGDKEGKYQMKNEENFEKIYQTTNISNLAFRGKIVIFLSKRT